MRFLWKYLRQYVPRISGVMGIKMAGTALELMIPITPLIRGTYCRRYFHKKRMISLVSHTILFLLLS